LTKTNFFINARKILSLYVVTITEGIVYISYLFARFIVVIVYKDGG